MPEIKITYGASGGKNKAKELKFFAWNNIPKLPKPTIEAFTRLGGKSLIVQQTRTEAVITQSTAFYKTANLLTGEVEQHINDVQSMIGKRGTWLDTYSDIEVPNFYILDASYSVRNVDPDNVYLIVWNFTCTADLQD